MKVDRNSATAVALRVIIEELIEKKGRALQRPMHDWPKTNIMRGELIGMRRILNEVSLQPVEDEDANESD
jgi:hypothetical protein